MNEFFQPFVNFAINEIIIPDFLSSGYIKMGEYYNGKFVDNLVIDATLPQSPIYNNGTMDVFTDFAIFFEKRGKQF